MPDQDFERAFATLAHAELAQKAPGLMPYLIGFQVVEKNDDGSRAAGVFGFKVGEQWYYGPVFWMGGKIRGYDLMYIVGQDLFVPMQEAWVNYVTNRKPYVMGDGVLDKNLTQLGVMQPDFTIFRRSPLTKGACEKLFKGKTFEPWCKPAAMYLPPSDEKYAGLDKRASLTAVLTKFPIEHTEAVLKAMKQNTKFAEAVYRFYPPHELCLVTKAVGQSALVKSATRNADRLISSKGGDKDTKVRVLYGTSNLDPDTTKQLTAKQREQLMHGDVLVDDKRTANEQADVYKNPEYEKVFQTPSISGMWKVMTRTGVIDALVGIHMMPIGKAAVPPNATVVIDTDKKTYALCSRQDVLAKTQVDPMSWQKLFETFRTAQNVGAGDVGVFVTKDFAVTQPFKVLKSTANADGSKTLCVKVDSFLQNAKNRFGEVKDDLKPPTQLSIFDTSVRNDRVYNRSEGDIGRPGSSGPCCAGGGEAIDYQFDPNSFLCDAGTAARESDYDSEQYKKRCVGHHIKLTRKPVSISNVQDTLIIGQDDVRFIPFSVDAKVLNKCWGSWSNLDLAGQADMDVQLRKLGMDRISVSYDGDSEFDIVGNSVREKSAGFARAMKTLIVDVGMSEQSAREILKEAGIKQKASYLVKQANPSPPMLNMDPISTYDSTYRSNVQVPQSDQAMIPSNAPYPNMQESMQPIVDPHAQNMAIGASNQGQKEVFDLSLLQSLIRSSGDTDGKIQDFLKDVILGNDRIGRILFLYYWHNDRFTERYGDKDLVELEDLLRETFKSVGDLVLFLKQKSIEPEAVATGAAVNL
jgi:hypothetical protein